MDKLGFCEAWFGEHHSTGWETGRAMFGVGPGPLPTDAMMLGIDIASQRDRMVHLRVSRPSRDFCGAAAMQPVDAGRPLRGRMP